MTEPGQAEPPLARVLGPVRIPDRTGNLVPPPGRLPNRLVVALALAGSDGRSVEGLADDVWPEGAPRNPRGALQMLVSRTRAVAADGLLVSSPTGYRLTGSDLGVAERAARNGDGDVSAALALWSGVPGADVDEPGLAEELDARADRARTRLLLARARSLVPVDPASVLEDLDDLVAARPLDAEPTRLRMQALAATGRRAEALAAFAAYRTGLADELGTDPDPSLVALNAELLHAGEAEVVGVRVAPTRLLGREDDVARLTGGVPERRLTSIVGAGGLGKTRLAHAVAAALAPRFGRVLFVELAGAREDEDLALVLGAAVGARIAPARRRLNDPPPPDLGTRIREALAGRPTLLVLDNCEQVIEAVAALTAELLGTVPALTVLTTTRVPLLLPGEWIHALQPLDPATDAVELFRERATAARPDARLDTATVARICSQLDGSPLAIELAAARLRSMTLDELDRRLADRFAVLVGGDRSAPARHRTLFAVIDWSWQLLTPEGRNALRMLSVFPDGFTAEGASTLLGSDATAALSDLVDQSLLTFSEQESGRGRYRMLETVREFGLRALADAGDTDAAWRAFDGFALRFCRAAAPGLTGGSDLQSLRAVAVEEETLLTVLRRPPHGREPVVLAVFALLAEFWIYRGEFERLPDQLTVVVDAGRHRPSDDEREEALRALTLAAAIGAITRAPGAPRALALLHRIRRTLPPDAAGFWPTVSGALLTRTSADETLAELARLTTSADPLVATFSSLLAGQLLENAGRTDEALEAAARAHRLAGRHGLAWFRLFATMSIAQLHSQRAERQEALHFASAALDEIVAFDMQAGIGQLEWTIAVNELALGRLDDAEARFRRLVAADDGRPGADGSDDRTAGLAGLAEVTAARGDHVTADRTWAMAIEASDRTRGPWRLIVGAASLAEVAQRAEAADAEVEAAYRRQRGRVLALARFPRVQLDVPVFATGLVALAAALLRPERSDRQHELAAALIEGAVPCGARLDFPSLEAVSGVRAALDADPVALPHHERMDRLVTLLRDPAARL